MSGEFVLIAFYFLVLMFSVIIHEVSHGFSAYWQGDPTAKYAGRLNFNPFNHIDPIGTVIVPLIMVVTTGFAFGWAKPVPFNPYNLKNQRWGSAVVAMSGPGSNILIAFLAAILGSLISIPHDLKVDIIRNFDNIEAVLPVLNGSIGAIFFEFVAVIIFWNSLLAFFNLIPIPPLDGSKILFSVVRVKESTIAFWEQFGFFVLILIIFLDASAFNILGNVLSIVRIVFFRIALI